jgi:hypothetical protein
MMYFNDAFKVLLAWVAFLFAQIVAGMMIHVNAPERPHVFAWVLLSDLLVVVAVAVAAKRSDWRGWKLASALVLAPFAINLVNAIEGSVFLKNSGIDWRSILLHSAVTYVLVLPLWWLAFGRQQMVPILYSPQQRRSFASIAWRFVVLDFAYLLLYYTAGTIIFPYVRQFYETQILPPQGTIIALQVLLRGPVLLLVCVVLARMIRPQSFAGALVVGLAFTILSGVAPLIIPNPYFPDAVRWVHFGEVTVSNFVFATIVTLLWRDKKLAPAPLQAAQAA